MQRDLKASCTYSVASPTSDPTIPTTPTTAKVDLWPAAMTVTSRAIP
ncbi:MAG: hypothetical protein F7B20_05750 [Aeropyrum sp.]|nr:hypothetical protein [Aeropyrum sp.]